MALEGQILAEQEVSSDVSPQPEVVASESKATKDELLALLASGTAEDPHAVLVKLAGLEADSRGEVDLQSDDSHNRVEFTKQEEIALSTFRKEIDEVHSTTNVLTAKLAELQETQAANPQEDFMLADEIKRIESELNQHQVLGNILEVNESRKRNELMLDSVKNWAWGRLKSDAKWVFVDVPRYFWKTHKEKQAIRHDQRRVNELSGLTGNALARKNREDMRAIRNENPRELVQRWAKNQITLSASRSKITPTPKA